MTDEIEFSIRETQLSAARVCSENVADAKRRFAEATKDEKSATQAELQRAQRDLADAVRITRRNLKVIKGDKPC